MDAPSHAASNAAQQFELAGLSGAGLFSPLVCPSPSSWQSASGLSGLLPLSSLPSPSHRGVSMIHADGSITRDGHAVCAMRDSVSLAVNIERQVSSNGLLGALSQPMTPLQSPLTPALGSLTHSGHSSLYLHSSSASAMSSTSSLFDLNPSSSAMSTPKANHGFNNHAQQDEAEEEEDASLDDELAEEEQDDDGREIDLDSEDESNPVPRHEPPHTNGNGLARSAATDETEEQQDDEHDRDLSDSEDDNDENALIRWVSESQRSGVDARTVLRRLLSDYSDVPISNKFLWKTAYSMSMHIQQQLLRASARRQKLAHINTLDDVVSLIKKSSKIVVLTGAGISVSAGIPDFRSRGGIYPRLRKEFGLDSPESMFDLNHFRATPNLFYSFARELWPGSHQPTTAHRFIRALEAQGKLLRNYTQNIDALESRAGIQNVLQCHGSFASARCMTCRKLVHGMAIHKEIMSQTIPKCTDCHPPGGSDDPVDEAEALARQSPVFGVMKPEITFFGESLPESFRTCLQSDRHEADLVIVMGSSLKVQPVAGMLEVFDRSTPMVLINREVVGDPDEFDVELLGLADEVCSYLAHKLEWQLPAIDPALDTFRELESSPSPDAPNAEGIIVETKQQESRVAAAAAAASNLTPPSLSNVALATPPPAPSSPVFIGPNRYCFAGAGGAAPSPTPSSQSLSPESMSLPSPMEQDLNAAHNDAAPAAAPLVINDTIASAVPQLDAMLATPAHGAAPTPSLTPAVVGSPKGVKHRPPPLHLSHAPASPSAAAGSDGNDRMHDMSLTCTPTKSNRFLALSPHMQPHHSSHAHAHPHAAQSPLFKALPSPAFGSTPATTAAAAADSTLAGSKRKVVEQPSRGEARSDSSTASAIVASAASSVPSTASAHVPQHPTKSAEVAATASAHLIPVVDLTGSSSPVIHQPAVKRRKVSVPERKEEV